MIFRSLWRRSTTAEVSYDLWFGSYSSRYLWFINSGNLLITLDIGSRLVSAKPVSSKTLKLPTTVENSPWTSGGSQTPMPSHETQCIEGIYNPPLFPILSGYSQMRRSNH